MSALRLIRPPARSETVMGRTEAVFRFSVSQ